MYLVILQLLLFSNYDAVVGKSIPYRHLSDNLRMNFDPLGENSRAEAAAFFYQPLNYLSEASSAEMDENEIPPAFQNYGVKPIPQVDPEELIKRQQAQAEDFFFPKNDDDDFVPVIVYPAKEDNKLLPLISTVNNNNELISNDELNGDDRGRPKNLDEKSTGPPDPSSTTPKIDTRFIIQAPANCGKGERSDAQGHCKLQSNRYLDHRTDPCDYRVLTI